jgi:[ribosomal protein S5]-alanine N-acetyltransferase
MFDFAKLLLPTPRLLLRPLRAEDSADLFALHADPEVMRYWNTPAWDDPALADAMIQQDQTAMAAGDHVRLAIAQGSDGRLLGLCSLYAFHLASRRAEIGYMLARASRGQGLMHEALCTLLDYGFGVLDLNRVEADIDTRNTASARTLGRLGFQLEGRLRERWIVAGEVSDTGLYGLLRRDWRAQRG